MPKELGPRRKPWDRARRGIPTQTERLFTGTTRIALFPPFGLNFGVNRRDTHRKRTPDSQHIHRNHPTFLPLPKRPRNRSFLLQLSRHSVALHRPNARDNLLLHLQQKVVPGIYATL